MTVLSSQPSVMIYTGNWLAGGCPETKSGGRYNDYDGVAIECQNHPDAVNHPEFPSPLLRPGRNLLPEDRIPVRDFRIGGGEPRRNQNKLPAPAEHGQIRCSAITH